MTSPCVKAVSYTHLERGRKQTVNRMVNRNIEDNPAVVDDPIKLFPNGFAAVLAQDDAGVAVRLLLF